MPIGMQVQSVSLTFSGGFITSASITFNMTGTGAGGSGTYLWELTSAEQNAAAATNFVTAFVNKLSSVLGLPVTTT